MDESDYGGGETVGDTGFNSNIRDEGFGSNFGDGGFNNSYGDNRGFCGGSEYTDLRRNSLDLDDFRKDREGPFTSDDKNSGLMAEGISKDSGDEKNHMGSTIYPMLAAASLMSSATPNENGEAPASLLLGNSKLHEESEEHGDGCGPIDCLHCSLVYCCTIL